MTREKQKPRHRDSSMRVTAWCLHLSSRCLQPCTARLTNKMATKVLGQFVVISSSVASTGPTLRRVSGHFGTCLDSQVDVSEMGFSTPFSTFDKSRYWSKGSGSFSSIPSWEDITIPRRTCLGRWAHLPEQTVITNGESSANEPSPTQTPDVPDLFDWSEFSGNDEEKEQLRALLVEFSDVVATSNEDVGQTNLMAHKIDVDGAAPVKQPPRRLPFHKREEVRKHLDQMLDADVVEPSSSPRSSPVVLVKKPDGSSRFCIDYGALNNVTKKDAYPLPRIDDTLDSLEGAKYFSTLDLQSGYWQDDVDSQFRDKTAFSTPFGLYQFKRMPFGLTNAPATFQRLMAVVFGGLTPMMCLVYQDDIIVFSTTFQEHVERLRPVLSRLREAGLKLKPRKCKLLCEHVRFLGHVVSVQGVSTDPEKIRAIVDWPTPTCVKDVRSFLGMVGCYRRFIRDFSTVARPMNQLLEKDVPFAWNEDVDRSFQVLKKALSSAPILSFPDFSLPFLVDTDASNSGLGAVLSQVGPDNVERPVYFASRTLNRAEHKYSTTRKELLAVVWALKTFRPYLLGAPFVLRTDHNALDVVDEFQGTRRSSSPLA